MQVLCPASRGTQKVYSITGQNECPAPSCMQKVCSATGQNECRLVLYYASNYSLPMDLNSLSTESDELSQLFITAVGVC